MKFNVTINATIEGNPEDFGGEIDDAPIEVANSILNLMEFNPDEWTFEDLADLNITITPAE